GFLTGAGTAASSSSSSSPSRAGGAGGAAAPAVPRGPVHAALAAEGGSHLGALACSSLPLRAAAPPIAARFHASPQAGRTRGQGREGPGHVPGVPSPAEAPAPGAAGSPAARRAPGAAGGEAGTAARPAAGGSVGTAAREGAGPGTAASAGRFRAPAGDGSADTLRSRGPSRFLALRPQPRHAGFPACGPTGGSQG